jgi:histidinol-phosphate aminotransferase
VPSAITERLWKVKPPFNVNLAAEVAVRATLQDLLAVQERVSLIIHERDRMRAELSRLKTLRVWPTQANFFLMRVLRGTAPELKEHLHRAGITIRDYTHPRLQDCIRISVGRPEDTDALVVAMREWSEHAEGGP